MRCCITEEQEEYILSIFAQEPDEGNNWSKQDVCEQIRKILDQYNHSSHTSMVIEHE